ncbi:MAG TPA: hypothetical protein ENI23_06825 [bacterium]|nr:hypothetical protein [bacterium]
MSTAQDLLNRETFDLACSPERLSRISSNYEKRSRSNINFWEYLRYLEDPRFSFKDVADILGVSKQAVHQIYTKWFTDIFPDRATKRLKIKYIPESLQGVRLEIEAAKAYGYLPKQIKMRPWVLTNRSIAKSMFVIQNGKRTFKCKYSKITNCSKYKNQRARYSRIKVLAYAFKKIDFLIVYQNPPGEKDCYYILPVKLLMEFKNDKGQIHVYFPLSEKYKPNSKSLINILLYKNAWNLLQGGKK